MKYVGGFCDGCTHSKDDEQPDIMKVSWCEQYGRKSGAAFFGISTGYVDIYEKTKDEHGVEFYKFINTF